VFHTLLLVAVPSLSHSAAALESPPIVRQKVCSPDRTHLPAGPGVFPPPVCWENPAKSRMLFERRSVPPQSDPSCNTPSRGEIGSPDCPQVERHFPSGA